MSTKEKAALGANIAVSVTDEVVRAVYLSMNPSLASVDILNAVVAKAGKNNPKVQKFTRGTSKYMNAVMLTNPFTAIAAIGSNLVRALTDKSLTPKCKARTILTAGLSNCKPAKPIIYAPEEQKAIQVERYDFKSLVYVPESNRITFGDTVERYSYTDSKPAPAARTTRPPDHADPTVAATIGSDRYKY
eukprot:jgi/Mesvir1/18319/Mv18472-RA.1